jgi:hypothetical protein
LNKLEKLLKDNYVIQTIGGWYESL